MTGPQAIAVWAQIRSAAAHNLPAQAGTARRSSGSGAAPLGSTPFRSGGHYQSNAKKGKSEYAHRQSDLFFCIFGFTSGKNSNNNFHPATCPSSLCQRSGHGLWHDHLMARFHACVACIKRFAAHEHRPRYSRVLVGQRHGRLLPARSLTQLVYPFRNLVITFVRRHYR